VRRDGGRRDRTSQVSFGSNGSGHIDLVRDRGEDRMAGSSVDEQKAKINPFFEEK
jgi:hypothetical protein